jgi:hypothetical protein
MVLAFGEPDSTDHVMGIDEGQVLFFVDGDDSVEVTVTVLKRDGDSYRVRVDYQ